MMGVSNSLNNNSQCNVNICFDITGDGGVGVFLVVSIFFLMQGPHRQDFENPWHEEKKSQWC